jgi:hypothetical protein
MLKFVSFGFLTYRAGFGCCAGGVHPAVTQGFSFGNFTPGTGFGRITGGICIGVTQGFAFCDLTYRAGLGCGAIGLDPLVLALAAGEQKKQYHQQGNDPKQGFVTFLRHSKRLLYL